MGPFHCKLSVFDYLIVTWNLALQHRRLRNPGVGCRLAWSSRYVWHPEVGGPELALKTPSDSEPESARVGWAPVGEGSALLFTLARPFKLLWYSWAAPVLTGNGEDDVRGGGV